VSTNAAPAAGAIRCPGTHVIRFRNDVRSSSPHRTAWEARAFMLHALRDVNSCNAGVNIGGIRRNIFGVVRGNTTQVFARVESAAFVSS